MEKNVFKFSGMHLLIKYEVQAETRFRTSYRFEKKYSIVIDNGS